jgi:hypothetical protein
MLAPGHPTVDMGLFSESCILRADQYMESIAKIAPKIAADISASSVYVPQSLQVMEMFFNLYSNISC